MHPADSSTPNPWDRASWPVIALQASDIVLANKAAHEVFSLEDLSGLHLSVLWSAENDISADEFLKSVMQLPDQKTMVRLMMKEEQTGVFSARVMGWEAEGRELLVIQLFLENLGVAQGQTEFLIRPASADALADSLANAQKQKLDCALKLARTMALDFNNTLTSILGHTSLLLSQVDAKHPWRKSLMEVERSAERAAEIAQDLALFSRQERASSTHEAGNLNDILRRAVQAMESVSPPGIEWKLHLESRLYATHFDEAKMQQALVKLLENAIESIPGDGRVVILSRNREIEAGMDAQTSKLAPGPYVCIEISDTGCGIAQEALPRIFEPFFTSKQGHRGLGLAWVYGIITNHGGSVAVSSQPGQGTVVRIYLPSTRKFVRERNFKNDDLRGHGTILIVDDEDLLLTMGQMILSSYGYTVLTASDGRKALELAQNPDLPLDLVITDLVMPGMSGRELVEHLKQCRPDTPILTMTGYVHPSLKSSENCLQKPFTSQSLLSKVKEVLNDNHQA